MPGAHLDLRLMQTYTDVGGCDAWMASYWDKQSQWHVGWHLPGDPGLRGLIQWKWPDPAWTLIGYERWYYYKHGQKERLREAFYHYPNPSTTVPPAPLPKGHWHIKFDPKGNEISRTWSDSLLEGGELYLKGGRLGPKGGGMNKNFGKGKDAGTGKGSGKGKGPGKGQDDGPNKGKGPGNGSGKGAGPKGKGGSPSPKGKGPSKGKGPGPGKCAGPKKGRGKGKNIDNFDDSDDIEDTSSTATLPRRAVKGKSIGKGKR